MLSIPLAQLDNDLASYMKYVSSQGNNSEVTLTEVVASRKDIPSSTATEEDKSALHDSPPDGGLFAWLQVLGGWILVMNSR